MKSLFTTLFVGVLLTCAAEAEPSVDQVSVDQTLDRLRAEIGLPKASHVSGGNVVNHDLTKWFFIANSGGGVYTCEEETTNPAEFIKIQRLMHNVEVSDTLEPATGKVVQTSLVIEGSSEPFVIYRGLVRCQNAIPTREASYAARKKEDARYQ